MTMEMQAPQGHTMATVGGRGDAAPLVFTEEQRALIRNAYSNGATDTEFAVLMEIAKARRLNPLMRQIHFVKRWDGEKRRDVWSSQVSIDGLRAIAERTGLYDGQDEPEFVESERGALVACKVRVYRKDWPRPAVGVAYYEEFVQKTREGKPNRMWSQMPRVMLAKVAESIALRKAFPEDTGGLYTPEEMGQADNGREDHEEQPAAAPRRAQVKTQRPELAPPPVVVQEQPAAAPSASQRVANEVDHLAALTSALAGVTTLGALREAYHQHAQGLHTQGTADAGLAAVRARLKALMYPLNAAEVQSILSSAQPDVFLAYLDGLAPLERQEQIVEHYAAHVAELATCGAWPKATARNATGRALVEVKVPQPEAKAILDRAEGVEPSPPDDGGSAPKKRRSGTASAQGSAAESTPANDATQARELTRVSDAASALLERHGSNPWALRNALKKHREELHFDDVPELARVLARITPEDPVTKARLTLAGAETIVRGLTGLRQVAKAAAGGSR